MGRGVRDPGRGPERGREVSRSGDVTCRCRGSKTSTNAWSGEDRLDSAFDEGDLRLRFYASALRRMPNEKDGLCAERDLSKPAADVVIYAAIMSVLLS